MGLLGFSSELAEWVAGAGEPAYRAAQVRRWVFGAGQGDPGAMTDLPRALRDHLMPVAMRRQLYVRSEQRAPDGTVKALLAIGPEDTPRAGGTASPGLAEVESVLIPDADRLTLCLSSQSGCAIGCPFCATGRLGLRRQLAAEEIAAQVLWAYRVAGRLPSHVVYMGMGEPLANYRAVMGSLELLGSRQGFGIGMRRITLSTSGVVPGILRLAEAGLQVGLAVSLHAPDDSLRDHLVPINRRYPLRDLMAACQHYAQRTRRRISFEYVLLRDVNDRPEHARALVRRVKGLLCHVNLIPYNPVSGLPFAPSNAAVARRFKEIVQLEGIPCTIRVSRGQAIQAACGQLGTKNLLQSAGEPAGEGVPSSA